MNSDKAAAVRDSINGCPDVVNDDDLVERNGKPFESRGRKLTGDRTEPKRGTFFRPAYVEQSGTVGDGNGATRPVYVVVLESLWTENDDARSLSPELVYEAAKHNCRIRFYPPDHRLGGAIWITDHFTEGLSNTDGDRCPECGGTYFKIKGGEPECARCGATEESVQTRLTEVRQ